MFIIVTDVPGVLLHAGMMDTLHMVLKVLLQSSSWNMSQRNTGSIYGITRRASICCMCNIKSHFIAHCRLPCCSGNCCWTH